MKDGVPVKDRVGVQFPTAASSIERSKQLARPLSHEHLVKDPNLAIMVVDDSGGELHRVQVYPTVRESVANSLKRIGR